MTTNTREETNKRHAAILADAARRVVESHRILSSWACRIDDHFSCLTVACCCGCHGEGK